MVENLLRRNRAWAAAQVEADPRYFERLVEIQTPAYLWIGCSDSRVPANVITDLAPGEVFVHRNVANLVYPNDLNLLSVLQYAIEDLRVRKIIVCGHYGCGGIRAALENRDGGLVDHWLSPIREAAAAAGEELARLDGAGRLDRLCELTVQQQVERLARIPLLQRAWKRGQELSVHGLVYRLQDGLLRDLKVSRAGRTA